MFLMVVSETIRVSDSHPCSSSSYQRPGVAIGLLPSDDAGAVDQLVEHLVVGGQHAAPPPRRRAGSAAGWSPPRPARRRRGPGGAVGAGSPGRPGSRPRCGPCGCPCRGRRPACCTPSARSGVPGRERRAHRVAQPHDLRGRARCCRGRRTLEAAIRLGSATDRRVDADGGRVGAGQERLPGVAVQVEAGRVVLRSSP